MGIPLNSTPVVHPQYSSVTSQFRRSSRQLLSNTPSLAPARHIHQEICSKPLLIGRNSGKLSPDWLINDVTCHFSFVNRARDNFINLVKGRRVVTSFVSLSRVTHLV